MKSLAQFKDEISKTPPVECDFKVGDTVIFTNDYKVSFSDLTVIGFADDDLLGGRFIYLDKDSYWFPCAPASLVKQQ